MDSRLYAAHQLFKQIGICSNGSSYLLKKNGQPFERLQLSMQKKNCHLFEWLGLSVQKKLSAVWMARAVCAKKKLFSVGTAQAIRWKNCQPFEQLRLFVRKKLATVQKLDPAICLKKNFAGFPFQNNFLTSYLCQMICYSPCILEWSRYELCLQTYHE